LLHLLRSGSGTNATKALREITSAYRGKADSMPAWLFSLWMTDAVEKVLLITN